VEQKKLVDLVLQELVNTMQPSISVRRVLEKHDIDYVNESIESIESVLKSKSLVDIVDKDSKGFDCFSLNTTGQDFLRSYGSYSKFLRGVDAETKRVERAKNKKPYRTQTSGDGKPPLPFVPEDESFLKRNRFGLLILAVVLVLFYIVSKITDSSL
jgi:hypothetical protein